MKNLVNSIILYAGWTSALAIRSNSSAPSVTIKNGTVIGQSDGTIDSFLGIPYAQPPIGNLRLKPPQPIAKKYGTINLPETPISCTQQIQDAYNVTGLPESTVKVLRNIDGNYDGPQGEDCLTISIQRPTGANKHSNLPVLFWIYGGGFETGNTIMYNGYNIINTSIEFKTPVVFVAVNYRVAAFGFLGGKELQADGSTNLGIRDQRLGLQWVAENIAAFGGDPNRVAIWGESAGSASVYSHLVINSGDNTYRGRPLFHAAIMDSGSEINTLPVDSEPAQYPYDKIVEYCGCSNATDTLVCLRSTPYNTLVAAQNSLPSFIGYRGNSLAYSLRQDPSSNFLPYDGHESANKEVFARVPVIIGNQKDEGTLFAFAQRNVTTTEKLVDYLTSYFPSASRQVVSGLVDTYPDSPAAGSPFGTGDANELYPQFKRIAAINGDITFQFPRRHVLSKMSKLVPTWSYLSTYQTSIPYVGSSHVSDIGELFGLAPDAALGKRVLRYYFNFVYNHDPNKGSHVNYNWPRYTKSGKTMLNISENGLSSLQDDFRSVSYDFVEKHANELSF